MNSKLKYGAVASVAVALLAAGFLVFNTFQNANESAMRSCLLSVQQSIVDSLTRDDFGIGLNSDWRPLNEFELGKLLENASRSGRIDCSAMAGIDEGKDVWGSPLEVSARREPQMKVEVKIRSFGRDKRGHSTDDIVLESR